MPENTPDVKVRSVQNLGGEYVTMVHCGSNFDAALTKSNEMREQDKQLVYVPPFDDPLVIAGQGTIGLDILSQMHMVGRTRDAIFLPRRRGRTVGRDYIVRQEFSPISRSPA